MANDYVPDDAATGPTGDERWSGEGGLGALLRGGGCNRQGRAESADGGDACGDVMRAPAAIPEGAPAL